MTWHYLEDDKLAKDWPPELCGQVLPWAAAGTSIAKILRRPIRSLMNLIFLQDLPELPSRRSLSTPSETG